MNGMNESNHTSPRRPGLYLLMALSTYGLYALSALGLSCLYTYCASDILLSTTLLPICLDILIQIIQLLLIPTLAWGLICYAGFRYTDGTGRRLFFLYLGSLLFCRLADLLSSLILYGSISLDYDLLYALWYFIPELILSWILYLWIAHRVKQVRQRERQALRAALLTNPEQSATLVPLPLHPFAKFYQKDNPLLSCLRTVGVVLSAIRVAQRLVYDIVYSIDAGALPGVEEIPVMLAYYLFDLSVGLIFYVGARWLCHMGYRRNP